METILKIKAKRPNNSEYTPKKDLFFVEVMECVGDFEVLLYHAGGGSPVGKHYAVTKDDIHVAIDELLQSHSLVRI